MSLAAGAMTLTWVDASDARALIIEAIDLGASLLGRVPEDGDVREVVAALRAMQEALPSSS